MHQSVTIVKVKLDEQELFRELMSDYLEELANYTDDLEANAEGVFEYDGFDLLFKKEALTPFFIRFNDEVVGFIILTCKQYVPDDVDYCIHELYIKPEKRKKSIAMTAVSKLFKEYKGKYQIVQLMDNEPAINFWRHVYMNLKVDYLESIKVVDDCKCYIQKFTV